MQTRSLAFEKESNFFWAKDLSSLLGEYETHRNKYPDLDSFFPEIDQFFNTYAASIERE